MSIRALLLGENPLEVERLWDKVYEGTIYHARRGLGIMLMSAIDNALHDLRGKNSRIARLPDSRGVRRETRSSLRHALPQHAAGPRLAGNAPCLHRADGEGT